MYVRTDRNLIRSAGGSKRFILVDVTAPEVPCFKDSAPVQVALVLERTGSMHECKNTEVIKTSAERGEASEAIRQLQPQDRSSVVAYDDAVVGNIGAGGKKTDHTLERIRQVIERDDFGHVAVRGWSRSPSRARISPSRSANPSMERPGWRPR